MYLQCLPFKPSVLELLSIFQRCGRKGCRKLLLGHASVAAASASHCDPIKLHIVILLVKYIFLCDPSYIHIFYVINLMF